MAGGTPFPISVLDTIQTTPRLVHQANDALSALAGMASEYDANGIDVHFLNSHRCGYNMRSALNVTRLFDSVFPVGTTPIGKALEKHLLEYLKRLDDARDKADAGDHTELNAIRPVNYIILTDGAPSTSKVTPQPMGNRLRCRK